MRPDGTSTLLEEWTEVSWGAMFSRGGGLDLPGVPVVLVHGLVVSSNYMVPLAEELARLCPVHAIDLPGFGRSCQPGRTLGIPELAESLEEWLAARQLPVVSLFGNSMGCQVLAEYALHHAHRIDKVVLQGPTVDRGARSYTVQLWRQLVNLMRDRSSLALMIARGFVAAGPRRALGTGRAALRDRIEDKLPRLQVPVLMVYGDRDPIAPPHWVEELAALLPKREVRLIAGGAHALNYSVPAELVRVMRPFLGL